MVNMARVKKKLPSLLTDEATTEQKGHNRHNQLSYRLAQLRRHDPLKYQFLTARLEAVLLEWEKAVQTHSKEAHEGNGKYPN